MMRMKKYLKLLLSKLIFIFNQEYNCWKEKLIEKKFKEEAKFSSVDIYSDTINSDYLREPDPSIEGSFSINDPLVKINLPGVEGGNEGSTSFMDGKGSSFPMPSFQSKNTTFELPKATNSGKDNFFNF